MTGTGAPPRSSARASFAPAVAWLACASLPSVAAGSSLEWSRCLEQPAAFYGGASALRVADAVLLHQRANGGWPKNVDMARPLDDAAARQLLRERSAADTTIDNGATWKQIRYLSRVISAGGPERLREGALRGIDFLLQAQYPNGGWPQFYPLRSDYSRHITYNDDAMVETLRLLREVAAGREPFAYVDAERRRRAQDAIARGLRVTLDAQVRAAGTLTAWCAQHDEVTLQPRSARAFEPAALSGRESVSIVEYLIGIESAEPGVAQAVESAVAWFRAVRIDGRRLEPRADASLPGGRDLVLVPDPAAGPLWARFYEIGTNRPIFCGRDAVVRYQLSEIEHERRNGYSWLGPYAERLLGRDYPAWKARLARAANRP